MRAFCLITLLALSMTGCGFQLRSYSFESSVSSFAIAGDASSAVAQSLRRGLLQAGVEEVSTMDAGLVMVIMDERNERRSISTSRAAQAAEYEISRGVQYQILGSNQQVLSPATWIERERVYRIDRGSIVGSGEERTVLERELMQDIVGQLIRAMDAVSRTLSDAG